MQKKSRTCKDAKYYFFVMKIFSLVIVGTIVSIVALRFYSVDIPNPNIVISITLFILLTFIILGMTICIFISDNKGIRKKYRFLLNRISVGTLILTLIIICFYLISKYESVGSELTKYIHATDYIKIYLLNIYLFVITIVSLKLTPSYLLEKEKDKYINYNSPFAYYFEKSFRANSFVRIILVFMLLLVSFLDEELWDIFNISVDDKHKDIIIIIFSALYTILLSFFMNSFKDKGIYKKTLLAFFILLPSVFVLINDFIPFVTRFFIDGQLQIKTVFYLSLAISFFSTYILYWTENNRELIEKLKKKIKSNKAFKTRTYLSLASCFSPVVLFNNVLNLTLI